MRSFAALMLLALLTPASWAQGRQEPRNGSREFPLPAPSRNAPKKTLILNNAPRIWLIDGARETRRDSLYWTDFRKRVEAQIGKINRAKTERDLWTAKQRGLLAAAQERQEKRQLKALRQQDMVVGGAEIDAPGVEEGPSKRDTANSPGQKPRDPLGPAKVGLKNLGEKAGTAVNNVAEAFEESFGGGVGPSGPKTASVLLSLLALLLVPALGVTLLALAGLSLKSGNKLQGGLFAAMGCVIVLLLVSASGEKAKDIEDEKRIRAEVKAQAATITAYVEFASDDGIVLGGVTTKKGDPVPTDDYGWLLLISDDREENVSSGETIGELRVFPAGKRMVPNSIGIPKPIPACTDSLDAAVAHRLREEQGSWWQRLVQL